LTIGNQTIPIRPFIRPRTKFIEDAAQLINGETLQEKTAIQGALDRHWYGEPSSRVQDSGFAPIAGVVNSDTDHLVYDSNLKCVIKDPVTGAYSLIQTTNGTSGIQESINRQKRFGIAFSPIREFASSLTINPYSTSLDQVPLSSNLSSSDVNQTAAVEEVYTIEIIDKTGTFTVYGSKTGVYTHGHVGEAYNNGKISFLIAFPSNTSDTVCTPGDAFVISLNKSGTTIIPHILKTNLSGVFKLIDESTLPTDASTQVFNPSSLVTSWIFIVERTDNADGNVSYWTVTRRDFNLVVESSTTKFWYNKNVKLVDPETKKPVSDMIRILKSNLDSTGTSVLGTDQIYDVVGSISYPDGTTNFNALSITPSTLYKVIDSSTAGTYQDPIEFLTFVGDSDYVYFKKDSSTGKLTPIEKTAYLETLTYTNDQSGNYVRKIGREALDFMWQHFTPNDHLIDPSTSNINDIFVLTRGYYSRIQDYIKGLITVAPQPETSLELRNSYRDLLESKMISDSVVMHSATVKLLFGSLAAPELRVKFRVVVAPGAKLTSDQIRARVLSIINNYFRIENWDFGQEFFSTELCAVIHKMLATEISSVVMVPEFPTNYFGDLFYIRSSPEEIFASCATLDNIEIVSGIDRLTLKQKA
jgi:hypothetical protein